MRRSGFIGAFLFTQYKMEEIVKLHILLQSTAHKIDDVHDLVIFKMELKRRTKSYLSFIEKIIEPTTNQMDKTEAQKYSDIVKEIDDIVNNLEITVK